tara:strand:- start:29755 stop:30000 length:246 start_codon:yes stop_codon:yes gene_type:complete
VVAKTAKLAAPVKQETSLLAQMGFFAKTTSAKVVSARSDVDALQTTVVTRGLAVKTKMAPNNVFPAATLLKAVHVVRTLTA